MTGDAPGATSTPFQFALLHAVAAAAPTTASATFDSRVDFCRSTDFTCPGQR